MNPELLWRIAITEATTPFDAINFFEPIPWETGAVDLIQLEAGEIEDMQKEGTLPSGYLSCGGPNSEYGYQHIACSCIEWRLETQKGIVTAGRNEYASRVQVLEGLQEHMDMNGQPVPERGVFRVKYDTCVRAMRELSDPAEQMDVLLRLRRRKTTWSILHLVSKGVRNRLLEFDCHNRNSEGCDGSHQEKKDYPTACDNSSFGASPWSRGRRARGTVQEWAEMFRVLNQAASCFCPARRAREPKQVGTSEDGPSGARLVPPKVPSSTVTPALSKHRSAGMHISALTTATALVEIVTGR